LIGASSGIGRELSKILSRENYCVGLAARSTHLLESLSKELNTDSHIKMLDVSKPDDAMSGLRQLIFEMDGVDLIVFCSGTGFVNPDLDWENEKATIDVNVTGFYCIANTALKYFIEKGSGHFAAISSVAALRGSGDSPSYSASKAFMSNYLEGLLCMAKKMKKDIKVTDIMPGFVDTKMAQGEGLFWVASPMKAAEQIYGIINGTRYSGYVTKRWRIIAWLLKVLPKWIYCRL